MSSGETACNIRLATTESWKDKSSGEKRELTEWHHLVMYRKLAEFACQYLRKGSAVISKVGCAPDRGRTVMGKNATRLRSGRQK